MIDINIQITGNIEKQEQILHVLIKKQKCTTVLCCTVLYDTVDVRSWAYVVAVSEHPSTKSTLMLRLSLQLFMTSSDEAIVDASTTYPVI